MQARIPLSQEVLYSTHQILQIWSLDSESWPRSKVVAQRRGLSSKLSAMKNFDELWSELAEKAVTRPADSSTVAALDAGVHTIGKKIIEEAGEVWLAAEHESNDALAEEISQLIYHLQTLMLARGLTPADIYKFL